MTKRQIEIPDDTWRQVRLTAYQNGTTATSVVNAAITVYIDKHPLPDMGGPEKTATSVTEADFVRPFNKHK